MIDHKNKFIFIHIPKTAGVSIEKVFSWNKPKPRHHTLDFYKSTGVELENYFIFSFVRNPYDLLVSWFYFQPGIKKKYKSFENWVKSGCPSHTEEQIKRFRCRGLKVNKLHVGNFIYIDKVIWNVHEHLMQHKWVECNLDLNVKLDFIGKFENLQQDFNIVCDKIKIPRQELPHKNATKHKHYTEYYNDETRQIVVEKYAKDIEMFGYEFGE